MFRRNSSITGLQNPESPSSMSQLPLSPAAAPAAPAASAPATPVAMAPRSLTPANAPAPKAGELPVSRFGGIPGVLPRRVGAPEAGAVTEQGGLRKLIVGREISLSGDITACDILVVEGNIEATLRDGRHLEITEQGHFKGSVEIDEADIAGKFEGSLTVRGRLKLRSGGQIEGTLSYGELEVEAGGRIIGEMKVLPASAQKLASKDNAESRVPAAANA